MLDHLYVDGTDLTTFGGYYFDGYTRNAPVREYTFYDIPGRNGSGLGPTSRLQNIEVAYDFIIDSEANLRSLRSFLMSREGYVRIEDSVHTTEYRMGVFEGPLEVTSTKDRDQHKGTIMFNCRPQRWLKSGEAAITLSSNNTSVGPNPTKFVAKPLIQLTVTASTASSAQFYTGTGGIRIAISATNPYTKLFIDSETMTVYGEDAIGNKNPADQYVSVGHAPSGSASSTVDEWGVDPPVIPAEGYLSYSTSWSSIAPANVKITPRWWEV